MNALIERIQDNLGVEITIKLFPVPFLKHNTYSATSI